MSILDIIFWAFAAFVVAFIAWTWLSMLFSRDRAVGRRNMPSGGGGGTGGTSVDMSYGETISGSGSDSASSDSGSDSGGSGDFSGGGGESGGGGSSGGW